MALSKYREGDDDASKTLSCFNARDIFLIFLFLPCCLFAENPWGKDADLVSPPIVSESRCRTPVLGAFAERMIRFHKEVISPADGPRSHHKPSSSIYTLEAMRKYGFFRGFLMGCDRLMRENDDPWIYAKVKDDAGDIFKYDPVR